MKAINAVSSVHDNLMYEGRFMRSTKELVASHTVLTSNNGTCAAFDMVDPSKLPTLVARLLQHEDEATLCAILAFSHDVCNCFYVLQAGCIPALYNVMSSSTRESSAYYAVLAVANVAGNVSDFRALTDNDGVACLMRAAQRFRGSARMLKAFVTAVMHLSFAAASRAEVANAGVPQLLLHMAGSVHGETLMMLLTTLKRFAADPTYHRVLLEAGAFEQLQSVQYTREHREAQDLLYKLQLMVRPPSPVAPPNVPGPVASRTVRA